MGYIKQLKDNDLVGGTTLENIYPITATSAVYGPDGRSLDQILTRIASGQDGGSSSGGGTSSSTDKIENIIIFGKGPLQPQQAWIDSIRSTRGIPSGWTATSNVPVGKDEYVYMATGKKVNNNFVTVEDNYYWSYPLRITNAPGDSSTSSTGADGSNINMVYYRTNTKVTNPAAITPTFGVSSIESITNKDWGLSPTGTLISNATTEAWRDHPLGIDKDHKYEYISVNVTKPNASGTAQEWQGYSSPALWSNWGEAGTDGDGVEYIFCLWPHYLQDTATSQIISKRTAGPNSSTSDPEADDFIPTNPKAVDTLAGYNWSDNPLPVTEADPYQYVSIRKRTWNEHDKASHWGEFSDPVLWSRYGRDGVATEYVLSSNNDQVVIDDNIHSNTSEALNADFVLMKNGEAVSAGVYYKINTDSTIIPQAGGNCWTPTINKSTGKLSYTIASSVSKVTEDIYKTAVDAYIQDSVNGTEIFDGAKYRKVASRLQIIQVKDFSAGEVYKLVVTPQALKVDPGTNRPLAVPVWNVKVLKIASDDITEISVALDNPEASLSTYGLSLECVSGAQGTSSKIPLQSLSDGTKTYDYEYFTFNLFYKPPSGTKLRVDTETINIFKDGLNGEGTYNVQLQNNAIILDDDINDSLSISEYNSKVLALASTLDYKLFKGDELVPGYKVTVDGSSSVLPTNFEVSPPTPTSTYLIYTGTSKKLTLGRYKLVLKFTSADDSKEYTKKSIDIIIDNITPDGTVFKLTIGNNFRVFTSEGEKVTTTKPVISVLAINKGVPETQNFKLDNNYTSSQCDLVVRGNGTYTPSGVTTSVNLDAPDYNVNGYTYNLYYKGTLVDSEDITCIKNGQDGDGKPGASGKSEYLTCNAASLLYSPSTNTFSPPTIIVSYMRTEDIGVNTGTFETKCDTSKQVTFKIGSSQGIVSSMQDLGTATSGSAFTIPNNKATPNSSQWFISATCENLSINIPISLEAPQGIEGCVVRQSRWKAGKYYRNDSALSEPADGEAARYIDVVWDGDNPNQLYMCKLSHESSASITLSNTSYWTPLESKAPFSTPLLITDNLVFKTGQGNNLYLMNENGDILGGLMSGEKNRENIRIFAGTSIATSSSNDDVSQDTADLNTAPFRVYDSGRLVATNAVIAGTINANNGQFNGDVNAQSFTAATVNSKMKVQITNDSFEFIGDAGGGKGTIPLAYFSYGVDPEAGANKPTVLLYIWDGTNNTYRVINLADMVKSSSEKSEYIGQLFTSSNMTFTDALDPANGQSLIKTGNTYTAGSYTTTTNPSYLIIPRQNLIVQTYKASDSSPYQFYGCSGWEVQKVVLSGGVLTVEKYAYIVKGRIEYKESTNSINIDDTTYSIYYYDPALASEDRKYFSKGNDIPRILNSGVPVLTYKYTQTWFSWVVSVLDNDGTRQYPSSLEGNPFKS